MWNDLEYVRQNGIDICINVVDTMWVCSIMNSKFGDFDDFVYESAQYATAKEAFNDVRKWLIKNNKLKFVE